MKLLFLKAKYALLNSIGLCMCLKEQKQGEIQITGKNNDGQTTGVLCAPIGQKCINALCKAAVDGDMEYEIESEVSIPLKVSSRNTTDY